jgi:hypothetical protein
MMLKPFLVGLFMAGVSAIPLAHAQVSMDISLRTAVDNQPLSNIPVILENLETGQVITGTTDRRGLVRFNGLSTSGEWIARTEPTEAYRAARTEQPIADTDAGKRTGRNQRHRQPQLWAAQSQQCGNFRQLQRR